MKLWVWYYISSFKKYQNSNKARVIFSMALSYNILVYWKQVIKKVNTSFFIILWAQMRLIFSRTYSFFQQKHIAKNNTWSWKSTDNAKSSSSFEKKTEYYSQINIRKNYQISWNLDELLKSYKAKYIRGGRHFYKFSLLF